MLLRLRFHKAYEDQLLNVSFFFVQQFFTGELDNYICNGDCRGIFSKEIADAMYPNATDITPYLQPNTGHASGLSKNASAGYEVMLEYLDGRGL